MRAVLNIESLFKKSQQGSTWIEALTFKAWGKAIKGRRTDFDWLSRIPEEVDAYVNDPDCGWPASISMWRDLIDGTSSGRVKIACGACAPISPFIWRPAARIPRQTRARRPRSWPRDFIMRVFRM